MSNELIIKLAKLANNNPNENEANLAARKVCKLLESTNFSSGWTTSKRNPPPSSHHEDPLEYLMRKAREAQQARDVERAKAENARKAQEESDKNSKQYEQYRAKSWDDVRRSEDPFWKSHKPFSEGFWVDPKDTKKRVIINEFHYVKTAIFTRWNKKWKHSDLRPEYISEQGDVIDDTAWHHKKDGWDIKQDYTYSRQQYKPPPMETEKDKYYHDPITGARKIKPEYKQNLNCTKCGMNIETGYVGHPGTFVCTTCQWEQFMKGKQ